MLLAIFSIYDTKAKRFGQPFFMHNAALAQRSLTEACMQENSEFMKHPLDYVLYEIGAYDDETGAIESFAPTEVITINDCIKQAEREIRQQMQINAPQINEDDKQ